MENKDRKLGMGVILFVRETSCGAHLRIYTLSANEALAHVR